VSRTILYDILANGTLKNSLQHISYALLMESECVPCRTRLRYEEVIEVDKHFRILGTRKRLTELLVSESGTVDVKKTIGLGVVVTGSMLAAILFAPNNATAGNCGTASCRVLETCCSSWSSEFGYQYWCCGAAAPRCGALPGMCNPL
jgi:hypothetical protein